MYLSELGRVSKICTRVKLQVLKEIFTKVKVTILNVIQVRIKKYLMKKLASY